MGYATGLLHLLHDDADTHWCSRESLVLLQGRHPALGRRRTLARRREGCCRRAWRGPGRRPEWLRGSKSHVTWDSNNGSRIEGKWVVILQYHSWSLLDLFFVGPIPAFFSIVSCFRNYIDRVNYFSIKFLHSNCWPLVFRTVGLPPLPFIYFFQIAIQTDSII